MELWHYYRILRKRKWLIIISTLVCVSIVGGITLLTPQRWEAYTTVMERTNVEEKISVFTAPYYYQLEPRVRLANLSQLVESQTVLQRSAETLWRLGISAAPEVILQTLNVRPVLDTMLLSIEVTSHSKEEAKASADVIASEFIRFYTDLNYGGAARSKEFIESALPRAEARLKKAREAIRTFKQETGMVHVDAQTDIALSQLSQFEMSLSQYQVAAQQSAARLASLERQLKEHPETRISATVMATNPVWQQLKMELTTREIELQKMLRTRKEAHPEVQALKRQLEETRRNLEETAREKLVESSTTKTMNPVHDALLQTYATAYADFAASDAARSAAQTVVGSLKPQLEALPGEAMRYAQLALDEESAKNTYFLLRQKLDEATIKQQEAENVSSIQVVDTAQVREAGKRGRLKLVLALLMSPMISAGLAFLLNYLDNTVRTPAQAEEILGLPVFAVVPMVKTHSLADPKCFPALSTSYQMLSTNLWFGSKELESRTILVASAEPDVGRSMTAANIAITLARDGARVILVDSDLRQPSQHLIFGVENDTGMSNVLAGQLSLTDALKPTSITDLLLLPSGPLPANAVRLLRSPEMAKFVAEINDLADFVVFDSPAGITFADSTLLAALIKNVVIVHAAGMVPRGAEEEFHMRLEQVNANILGAVLNMARPEDSHGYYHFRSAYEELLRDGKYRAAVAGRAVEAIAEEAEQEAGGVGRTES